MRWVPFVLVACALAGAGCSDDNDAIASLTTTTAEPATATSGSAGPTTFCAGFASISFSLDEITRTMMATMNGEEPAEFIVVLEEAVETMAATAELAPDAGLAEQAMLVAATYAGFEELLLETAYDIVDLPVDDPRAASLADPALAEAIGSMNDHCSDSSEPST